MRVVPVLFVELYKRTYLTYLTCLSRKFDLLGLDTNRKTVSPVSRGGYRRQTAVSCDGRQCIGSIGWSTAANGDEYRTRSWCREGCLVATLNYMYDATCSARKLDVRSEIKNPWIGKNWIFWVPGSITKALSLNRPCAKVVNVR